MVKLALKMVNKEEIGTPEEEGYIPRGIRKNYFAQERGSKRAVDMLVKSLRENLTQRNCLCRSSIVYHQLLP